MVACGSAHTVALCRETSKAPKAPAPPPLELHLLHQLPDTALHNRLVNVNDVKNNNLKRKCILLI